MKHTPAAGQVLARDLHHAVAAGGRKDTPDYEPLAEDSRRCMWGRKVKSSLASVVKLTSTLMRFPASSGIGSRTKGVGETPQSRSRLCGGTQRAPRTQFQREG